MHVAVPETSVSLSINTLGNPIAGRMYNLFCITSVADGIQSTPILTWLDSNGYSVTTGDDITVGPPTAISLPLQFNILRESNSGTYTCSAILYSLALQVPLVITASFDMSVQRKKLVHKIIIDMISLYTVGDPLSVSILSTPLGPEISAAEPFSLSCHASGGTGVYNYQWSSTCTGNCVLSDSNMAAQTISHNAARSADSGVYTCTVNDNAGNDGTNSTEIQVTGKILYLLICKVQSAFVSTCFVQELVSL